MRIISGKYKHKRIDVPTGFKARPTTDFAKESLFNILQNVYTGFEGESALDLFAGTGSISLEMLSRGCDNVVSVEKDYRHYQFLARTAREIADPAWHPTHNDVFKYLKWHKEMADSKREHQHFDIIFADPPYAIDNLDTIPDLIFQSDILNTDGIFILEHGKDYDFSQHPHFEEHRMYGSVNFSFFM